MSLPLQVRSYLTPLYAQALSAIYQFYDQTRDPSYALAQDVDIYEIMMRDPKIFQGVQERLLSVAGPNWRVFAFNNSKDPADIAIAKLVDDALRFAPHFIDSRQRSATAIFRGQSCELMSGKRKMLRLGQDKKARNWWMFTEFKNIDPRRFTYRNIHETQDDGTKTVRTELWMSTMPMWQGPTPVKGIDYAKGDMPSSLMAYGYRKVEHPEWLCRVVYNDEEARLGYGRGLVDCLYFYHWIKQILLREGLQGVERWSQGIVVGTMDPDRPGSPDAQTNAAEQQKMLTALSAMRSRHVYVQGKHDDIEVLQGGGEGHQMVMGLIEYVDDCIMAVCTGAVLMSSKSAAGDAGSHARDDQGAKTQNKVIIADQLKIDEDQSGQMVGMWVRQNWMLLRQVGLELGLDLQRARPPQIKTIAPKEINPTDAATRYSTIWQANPKIKFRKDDFYESLGETPVNEEEDEWVEGADPAQVASAAGNPGNDPSQMMMEGAGGAPQPPTPQGTAMRSRSFVTPEAIENMINRKVEEQVAARMRLITEPKSDQRPVHFHAGPVTVNAPAGAAPVVHVEGTEIHNHLPESNIHVQNEIDVPEQVPPDIHVHEGNVDVHVPEQPAPVVVNEFRAGDYHAPDITVNVPKAAPPVVKVQVAAPKVEITNEVKPAKVEIENVVNVPEPKRREIKFETDKEGRITGATSKDAK